MPCLQYQAENTKEGFTYKMARKALSDIGDLVLFIDFIQILAFEEKSSVQNASFETIYTENFKLRTHTVANAASDC